MADYTRKPVFYNGVRYPSTIEGKYALILDNLGAKWEYEPFEEDGYKPDFVVHNVYQQYCVFVVNEEQMVQKTGDLYIETKVGLYPERRGVRSDNDKYERFMQRYHLILATYINIQYLNNWDDFVNEINRLSVKPLEGYNPNGFCAYSYELIEGTERPAVLVKMKNNQLALSDLQEDTETIDKEATLKAYRDAFRRVLEDATGQLEDKIKTQEYKIAKLEKQLERKKEKKSKKWQVLIRPTLYNQFKIKAETLGTSANDLLNTLVEEYIYGDR